MTSKNLSSNKAGGRKFPFVSGIPQKELAKRRLWVIGLIFLLFFLYHAAGCLILLQTASNEYVVSLQNGYAQTMTKREYLQTTALTIFGTQGLTAWIAMFAGIILPLQGFSWLFDRRSVDFYASQPVSRKEHFCGIFSNSLLIYLAGYLLSVAAGLLICAAYGAFGTALMAEVAKSALIYLFIYFAAFSLGTLAAMLTGNAVVACLAMCVFIGYEPLLRLILNLLGTECFSTFVSEGTLLGQLFTAPLYNALQSPAEGILRNFLLGAVCLGLAYFAFMKRKNEQAGEAVVFPLVRSVVKVAIAFLGGITVGTFFFSTSGKIIGFVSAIVFAVIVSCVMEIIYAYDFKALFNHLASHIAAVVLLSCVLLTFFADPFGFDTWVPDPADVTDAAIVSSSYYTDHYYRDGKNCQTVEDFYEEYMHLTDVESVTRLAEECISRRGITPSEEQSIFGNERVVILYRMKNGSQKQRTYMLPPDIESDIMDRIMGTQEFREGYFPIYQDDYLHEEDVGTIYIGYSNSDYDDMINADTPCDYDEFRKAYISDLEKFDLTYLRTHRMIGTAKIVAGAAGAEPPYSMDDHTYTLTLQVYEGFDHTISFLKNAGLFKDDFDSSNTASVSDITISLTMYDLSETGFGEDERGVYVSENDSPQKTYTDPGEIRSILSGICPGAGRGPFSGLVPADPYYYIIVKYRGTKSEEGDGNGVNAEYLYFAPGGVPKTVEEDFAKYLHYYK